MIARLLADRATPRTNEEASEVRCVDVSLCYPGADSPAISGIDMTMNPGSITALVGPSGCGKSTALKVIGGMLRPSTGQVILDGADATRTPLTKRRVGWVPQQYALFEHLDVRGNVEFGLRAQRFRASERDARTREMLELCELDRFADRPVTDLSGGQRQRVAIARALAPHPRVLLLDEPLAALDPQLRSRLRGDLATLMRSSGVTSVLVTHDQEEALALSDQLVVLNDGEIVQAGTPEQIWQTPATAWAAQFVGGASVVPIERTDGHRAVLVDGLAVNVRPDSRGLDAVALLPADLRIGLDPGGAAASVISAEYVGEYVRVTVELPGGARVAGRASERFVPGDSVYAHASDARAVPAVAT